MRSVKRLLPAAALSALVAVGCGGGDALDGEPIKIALLAPKTGVLAAIGESFERVFNVAIDEINAKGGIEGRPLVSVVKDTELSGDIARMRMQEAIAEGVVAIVGPAASGEVSATYPTARDAMVPMMSPSSTLAALSKPEVNDGGFLFRNVPDDETQSVAAALYLTRIRNPRVTSIAVVYEDTDYGRGLRDGVEQAMEGLDGQVIKSVAYPQSLTNPQAVIDELATANPTMTLLIALGGNGIAITNAWATSGKLPEMQWLFTDGSRSSDFLIQTPDKIIGMCGTAATFPVNGLAYKAVTDAYEGLYAEDEDPTARDLDAQVYAPNVWDAVHLFALGMVQQSLTYPGEPIGGTHLAEAVTSVSAQGQVFRADQWRNMVGALRSGGDVDYDGAAGPNDFDDYGQAVGPYEVWCIDAGTPRTFTQAAFLEAEQVKEQAAPAP